MNQSPIIHPRSDGNYNYLVNQPGLNPNANMPQKPEKRSKYPLWKNLLAMIVLVVLYVGGAYWAADYYTLHGKEIGVPDLKGLTQEQAIERLESLGLEGEVVDSVYNTEVAKGLVCSQSVRPGNKVKIGRTINLMIRSYTAPTLILPNIADNCSYVEAKTKLTTMGFQLTQPEYINGERDWVYGVKYKGTNIGTGTKVPVDGWITLVVGNGTIETEETPFAPVDNYSYDSTYIEGDYDTGEGNEYGDY